MDFDKLFNSNNQLRNKNNHQQKELYFLKNLSIECLVLNYNSYYL